MDDAKVLQACRLLYEALCDDLELRRLLVEVDRDRVSITIPPIFQEPGRGLRVGVLTAVPAPRPQQAQPAVKPWRVSRGFHLFVEPQ